MAVARTLPWYQRLRPGALYLVGIVPAGWTFYLGVMDQLGADPMKALERTLGEWALRFLIACLAITPLRRLTASPVALPPRRRPARLHLRHAAPHHVHGAGPGPRSCPIWADIVNRPYITIGMAAFLILSLWP